MRSRTRATLALALSLTLAATSFAADKAKKSDTDKDAAKYPVPAGLHGFTGTLEGTVVSVQDHMRGFVMKVTKVLHVNSESKAKNPESAVGEKIEITPTVTKTKDGKYVPDEREVRYIQSLEKGQDIQLDVSNVDATHLRIDDLTKAEKAQAERQKK